MTDTRDSLQSVISDLRRDSLSASNAGTLTGDMCSANFKYYADRLTALQAGAGDGVEEYEVWQDDMLVAGAAGKGSLQEALHYAAQYEQDGPVTIYKVTRQDITAALDNAQATETR